MKIVSFKDKELLKHLLLNNQVIAFPTETVFGLGVVASNKTAFDNLVKIKRRPPDKPFTLMCSSIDEMQKYVVFTNKSLRIAEFFMPGSLTMILPVARNVPEYITLGTKFIGIRIPETIGLRDLISYVGCPLLVPSANKSGDKPATTVEEVKNYFDDEIEVCVDGVCSTNEPSTIIMIDKDDLKIIRQGPISEEEIRKVWEKEQI